MLKSDEGFQIQERGTVELKGKGVLTTYWLAGKEGYDRSGSQMIKTKLVLELDAEFYWQELIWITIFIVFKTNFDTKRKDSFFLK